MNEQKKQAAHDATRKKIVFGMMFGAGIIAVIICIVSIAILVIGGLMLLITAIGSMFMGRYLLGHAREWRQRHLTDTPHG